ncbi:hypothetical protein PMZ80_009610 [Knufia obscura]|uniref:Uncharacterized protein n=1 Tax=Knufia obscura TaxID=1635080 RepID=A0ABR0RBK5_9EURO|nr:hypothetical protein PMZ80_009610 [Knufia obscura]
MAEPDVENWDDEFDNFDDIQFRSASTATSIVSHPQANHRDSTSSRMSMRSDSNQGDEHWDVMVDEQSSVKDALTIAKSKGIPLPSNLPRSALEGGTIRRLGGKAVKKVITDDWSEDLDLANAPPQLRLAKAEERDLSESLRQISAAFRSSPKSPEEKEKSFLESLRSPKSRLAPTPVSLENFRDVDDDDGFGDVPTIRVAKHRSPQKMKLFSPAPPAAQPDVENLEGELEIPTDGKLRLSTQKLTPKTPLNGDDFDVEWAEGSLGTRHAGTRRGGMSNRSSSISAMSPSVSSAFTGENEEDDFNDLVLPQGPVNFKDILKRRQESEKENEAPPSVSSPQQSRQPQQAAQEENWDEDIVIPNGKVFDGARLTLHRNVKQKNQRSNSPGKIKSTTLNFTTTKNTGPLPPRPRFGFGHERQERPRSHLEPVSETGAPIQRYQRPNSRLGHAATSSVSSIPAPATPTPSTPSRRDLRNAGSRVESRYQPATTTNAQLLRTKRSMPAISGMNSPTRSAFNRPPSRQDGSSSRLRPRSPERPESRLGVDKKGTAPFLPAGASTVQSKHRTMKTVGTRNRRTDSDGSVENMTPAQRSLSRLNEARPQTPGKGRSNYSVAELAAQAKKTMNKPLRRRNWGDGSELESFDDLPTSTFAEEKYTKQPVGRGAPRSLRSKIGQHGQAATSSTSLVSGRSGGETPVPTTPLSPPKLQGLPSHHPHSSVPRFARDTAASRIAREQRSISAVFQNMRGEPLAPVSTNAKATILPKPTYGSSLRRKKPVQQKPHLIKPMGEAHKNEKEEKGMFYNPDLCRWEGNDTALTPFDVPDFLPRQPSPGEARHPNIKAGGTAGMSSPANASSSKPNLALIMNVGGSSGVQLVNGMVFDPRQMKWLKVAHGERGESIRSGAGSVQLEEEEDVFAGLEDLKEESENMSSMHDGPRDRSVSATHDNPDPFTTEPEQIPLPDDDDAAQASGHSSDEWGVAEEFDVGPDFVRRQRSEEERWRRKVEKWLRSDEEVAAEEGEGLGDWRWAIRELVSAHAGEGATEGAF